ncbi:monovalent cation/H(+) antiporter subunit G [Desulfobulbus alkaliphilus]|uniref:monovalent cation/H(+) antiporter subunit G n=1 Tax=Desulfobulbus alkaliphilus TaxID=869814 RepID=UPI00196337E6|nr:monovalent cation/H(+) antiporter subunit G [Desulfobulbus alkaliphilus]MBM9537119.1 monovalent cation/H(+) antiporter subunit G [Desulfobulbus alkaliphilus]
MSAADIAGAALVVVGVLFFLSGTLGLLRFPDIYTRIHALTKADNLGLGLICLGSAVQSGSLLTALKLLLVWILVLLAAAAGASLIAQTAHERGIRPWERQE